MCPERSLTIYAEMSLTTTGARGEIVTKQAATTYCGPYMESGGGCGSHSVLSDITMAVFT